MTYAEITRNDPNAIKCWLQRRRIRDAISIASEFSEPSRILDFGGGDGELCRMAASRFPHAQIYCYEPGSTYNEAVANLNGVPNVRAVRDLSMLPASGFDLVFCTEVFEHLPERETAIALDQIRSRLAPNGIFVIGVPLELYMAALLKGSFRMSRRRGGFDARWLNILGATLGFPPKCRPVAEIVPGLAYHPHHMGFDHRTFQKRLGERFEIVGELGSPLRSLKSWVNSELYLVARPESRTAA